MICKVWISAFRVQIRTFRLCAGIMTCGDLTRPPVLRWRERPSLNKSDCSDVSGRFETQLLPAVDDVEHPDGLSEGCWRHTDIGSERVVEKVHNEEQQAK